MKTMAMMMKKKIMKIMVKTVAMMTMEMKMMKTMKMTMMRWIAYKLYFECLWIVNHTTRSRR